MIMRRKTLYGAFFLALIICSTVAMINNDDDDDDRDDDDDDDDKEGETSCVSSNGVKIKAGEEKFISACVFCSCIPGERDAVCGAIDCPPADCKIPRRVKGKCCPVCQ